MWKFIVPVAAVAFAGSLAMAGGEECPDCPKCPKEPAPPAAPAEPKEQVSFTLAPANGEKLTLEGVDLGKEVAGPAVKAADLKGKAVVFEYWGDQCGPCLASIPHVCAVQKEHGREKLIVVANQVWTEDVAVAKAAFEKHAPKDYQVSVVNHGAVKGAEVDGVPHAMVFNPDGTLRWEGNPHPRADGPAFEKAVAEAVALVK